MKKLLALILTLAMVFALGACSSGEDAATETTDKETTETTDTETTDTETTDDATEPADDGAASDQEFTIGYAQREADVAYTVAMMEDNQAYAAEHYPNVTFVNTDAQGDAMRQSQNVADLVARGVDLIMVSPLTEEGLTDAVAAAMDAGIPVVTMDRTVACDVTCKVIGDNYQMGADAADKLAEMMGESGNIIQVCGTTGASATVDRQAGFEETVAEKYPNMKIVDSQDCDYNAAEAASFVEDMLQKYGEGEIQAIYCHNDVMAQAACEVLAAAGRDDEGILVCGMDGEEASYQLIESGAMAFTIIYPTMAPEGIIAAYNILTGQEQEPVVTCTSTMVDASNIAEYIGTGLQ